MTYTAKTTVVSDITAVPAAKVAPTVQGGAKRVFYGDIAAADMPDCKTAAQTIAVLRVPANLRVTDLRVENATMGNGAFDFDLYRTDGVTAVTSAGAFLADFPLTAHSFEGRVDLGLTPANAKKTIAELFATEIGTAGATGDAEFDLVASVVTVTTGTAVTMAFQVEGPTL